MSGVSTLGSNSPTLRSTSKKRSLEEISALLPMSTANVYVPAHMTPVRYNTYMQQQLGTVQSTLMVPGSDDDDSDEEDDDDPSNKRIKRKHLSDPVGGSSCHQCKSRRATHDLTFCSHQLSKKNKATSTSCRKKYCDHCLRKFYKEKVPSGEALATWKCPACRGVCCCAACRKRTQKDRPDMPPNPLSAMYPNGIPTSHQYMMMTQQQQQQQLQQLQAAQQSLQAAQSQAQAQAQAQGQAGQHVPGQSMQAPGPTLNFNSMVLNRNSSNPAGGLKYPGGPGMNTPTSTSKSLVSPSFGTTNLNFSTTMARPSSTSSNIALSSFSNTPASHAGQGGAPNYLSLAASASSPPSHSRMLHHSNSPTAHPSGLGPSMLADNGLSSVISPNKGGLPRGSPLFAPMAQNASLLDAIKNSGTASPVLAAASIMNRNADPNGKDPHAGISALDLSTSPVLSGMMGNNPGLADAMFTASSPMLQSHNLPSATPSLSSMKAESLFSIEAGNAADNKAAAGTNAAEGNPAFLSALHGSPHFMYKPTARSSSMFSLGTHGNPGAHVAPSLTSIAQSIVESGTVNNVQFDVGAFALCWAAAHTPTAKQKITGVCNSDAPLLDKASSIIDAIRLAVHQSTSGSSSTTQHSRSLLASAPAIPSVVPPNPSPVASTVVPLTNQTSNTIFSPTASARPATGSQSVVIPTVMVNYSASSASTSTRPVSHASLTLNGTVKAEGDATGGNLTIFPPNTIRTSVLSAAKPAAYTSAVVSSSTVPTMASSMPPPPPSTAVRPAAVASDVIATPTAIVASSTTPQPQFTVNVPAQSPTTASTPSPAIKSE